jgi:hypothetical protein
MVNPSNSAAGVDSANFVTAAVTGGLVSPPPPVRRARKSSACGALTVGQCGCRHRVFSYFQSPFFWASCGIPENPVDNNRWGIPMRKSALLLAVILAACFTLTGAEAAKKKAAKPAAKPADAAYEWNLKNMPPMAAPGAAAAPAAEKKPAKKSKAKAKKA